MRRRCAMAALAVWAKFAVAQPPALELELKPAVLLGHGRVTLADVAILGPGAARLAALELGTAPRVGYVERLSREQIALSIRRRAGVTQDIAWSGAASVALQTRSQTVASQALAQAALDSVKAAYQARFPSLVAEVATAPADLELPPGAVEIRARALSDARLTARMPVWLDIRVDGVVYRSLVVALLVSARQPVYVARRALPADSVAGDADFELRDENVAALEAVPAQPPPGGWRLRRALAAGQVLTQASLPPAGMIFRGDQVRLLIRGGGVEIEAQAVALADAGPGQQVALRMTSAREPVIARVGPTGAVVIDMK